MGRLYNLSAKALELVKSAVGDADKGREIAEGMLMYKDGYLTSAQVQALNTTQISVISAPGAGKAILVVSAYGTIDYGTATYEAGTNTLDFRYTNASGGLAAKLSNAFLEASADAIAYSDAEANVVPVANAALVASCASNPTTGDSLIYYRIWYRIVPSLLSA